MSDHQLIEILTGDTGGLVAHTECFDVLSPVDMHVIDTGDKQIAVFVLAVDAAEAAILKAAIKARVDAGLTALASQMDDLGLRDAIDSWAVRSTP